MFQSNLLVTRKSRDGIKPVFAEHSEDNLTIAQNLISQFSSFVGKRKGLLNDEFQALEEESHNYRFLRGLFTLLERRTITEQKPTSYEPFYLRQTVFGLANQLCKGTIKTKEDREVIFSEASNRLGIPKEDLVSGMWADEDDELIIRNFELLTPEELIGLYNLSLLQTMLFKANVLEISFGFTEDVKELLRRIRFYGLMYDIEKQDGRINLIVNGPISVLKMTKKYGTSLAKFLPYAIKTDSWQLRANILEGRKVLKFSLTQDEFNRFYTIRELGGEAVFDSSVEEKFFNQFRSLGSNWVIKREPEPLIKDSVVMIPDFSFEGYGRKVFMEIMGFWTPDYVKKKLEKLRVIANAKTDIILCIDENLQCSPSRLGLKNVIKYKKRVPVKEIIEILGKYEIEQIDREIGILTAKFREDDLTSPVLELNKLSGDMDVSVESMKKFLKGQKLSGYVFTGNLLLSKEMMSQLLEKMDKLMKQKGTYKEALSIIGDSINSEFCAEVFDKLGFTVEWSSLDVDSSMIGKS